jgi:DNA-binding response OmpR family regulator
MMLIPPILIVEDDSALRTLLAEILQDAGHAVCTAGDGLAALEHLATLTPRLIILDEQMPHLDGRGFVAALEAQGIREQFAILVVSGSNRHLTEPIHAEAHLQKPFDLDTLLSTVASLLANGASQTSQGIAA